MTEAGLSLNPLHSDSPDVWSRLIESIGPASLLVVIDSRMSSKLKRRLQPEDILQETFLHVWRDRQSYNWTGTRPFRAWVLNVIDNRIRDAARHEGALKRGGSSNEVVLSALRGTVSSTAGVGFDPPAGSTTPSRLAVHREQAAAMSTALNLLPDELRDVVRMRLFEQCSIADIARALCLSEAAVRHRFRKGSELYQRRLLAEFATRSSLAPGGPSMNDHAGLTDSVPREPGASPG